MHKELNIVSYGRSMSMKKLVIAEEYICYPDGKVDNYLERLRRHFLGTDEEWRRFEQDYHEKKGSK